MLKGRTLNSILLIQTSLNPDSKTAVVIQEAADELARREVEHEILDLRRLDLQFCDGRPLSEYNRDMQQAYVKVESAAGYIWGMPVYCFSVSGVLKNFIDITANAMENKVSATLCNAGGNRSYMAFGDLSKILAFESRVTTVQPSVYTSYEDFENGQLVNPAIRERINEMLDALLHQLKLPK